MRWLRIGIGLGVAVALVTVSGVVGAAQGGASPVTGPMPAQIEHSPQQFAGLWEYDELDSVNVATGKPEQAPRSAARRVPGIRSSAAVPSPAFGDFGGRRRSGVVDASGLGPTQEMVREARNLSRDLLEVPESLTIVISPTAVTFTDDLDRARTYPTDDSKHPYQLGAARFDARVRWEGSQLWKDVSGDYGFKMTETYLLSPDGQRLFVIVRVGKEKKDAPLAGFNRVYDRVSR